MRRTCVLLLCAAGAATPAVATTVDIIPLVETEPNDTALIAEEIERELFTNGGLAVDGTLITDDVDIFSVMLAEGDFLSVSIVSTDADSAFVAGLYAGTDGFDDAGVPETTPITYAAGVGENLSPIVTIPTFFGAPFEVFNIGATYTAPEVTQLFIVVSPFDPTNPTTSVGDYKLTLGLNPSGNEIPSPGSAALVALAGLLAITRRR